MSLVFEALKYQIENRIRRERLVFWADESGAFQAFVEKLSAANSTSADTKYSIVHFQGSILENLLKLHPLLQDIKKPDCLVYVPFMSEETLKASPYLEAWLSSDRIAAEPAQLLTAAGAGFFSPEQLQKLLAALPCDYNHLEALLSGSMIDLSIFHDPNSVVEFALKLLTGRTTGMEDLKAHPAGTLKAIEQAFERLFGFDTECLKLLIDERDIITSRNTEDHGLLRLPLAFHLLACEYVNDLEATAQLYEPLLGGPGKKGRNYLSNVRKILDTLRGEHAEAYRQLTIEVEQTGLFDREKKERKSDELGKIDTFLFEDILHQLEAMRLLATANYARAATKAAGRMRSFWYLNNTAAERFWNWLTLTAGFGAKMEKTSVEVQQFKTLEDLLQYYATELWRVDQMHREFLSQTDDLRQSDVREYQKLLQIRTEMLKRYYQWLETINFHYQKICERNGYLPQAHLQQRNLYHNEFAPLIQSGKTAIFFVDALRYEVGEYLQRELEAAGINSEIKALYAELPTITAVGMNALVPVVQNGELTPVISGDKIRGFKARTRQVLTPQDRRAVLEEISQKRVEWLKLDELVTDYRGEEKNLQAAELLIVHSLEIDEAGESDFLAKGFDFFQETVRRIRLSMEKLRRSQFTNFCIVSDHGFIQYEPKSDRMLADNSSPAGGSRRYFLAKSEDAQSSKFATVDMGALNYSNTGKSLSFLRGPQIFRNSGSTGTFFHGGNSLQERVIPLIILQSAPLPTQNTQGYAIRVKDIVVGRARHQLKLYFDRTTDGTLFPADIRLMIEAQDAENARVQIISCRGGNLSGTEIILSTNATCLLEFEIQAHGHTGQGDRLRIRIAPTAATSTITEFSTAETFPVVSLSEVNESVTPTQNVNIPATASGDVERILRLLAASGSHTVTEQSLNQQFRDTRITQRAIRQFSIFLKEHGNELEYDIVVETGPEGKMFRIRGN